MAYFALKIKANWPWPKIVGIGLVNVATFTWATNQVVGRWLRHDIDPITLSAGRFVVASLVLALLLQRRPVAERRLGRDGWWLLGMALCGVAIFNPMLYLGLHYTTVVNATLLNGLAPLATGLLAAMMLGESMTGRQVVGAGVGLVGVTVLMFGGSLAAWRNLHVNRGDILVLGALLLWVLYSVLGRRVMRHRSALSATAFSAFLGLPFLLVGGVWQLQNAPVQWSLPIVLAIVYIGIAPTVVGILAWNVGVRRMGPTGVMVFYNTMPLYGALLAYWFLGETLGWQHVVGGALIIGAGMWASYGRG